MGDVIEHLVSPGRALRRVMEVLAPGGVLWLALPDAGSATARTTVRYYLERIAGCSPSISRALVATATALRLGDRMWAPDLRDRMAVIARARWGP